MLPFLNELILFVIQKHSLPFADCRLPQKNSPWTKQGEWL
jgi:hypothetical protein